MSTIHGRVVVLSGHGLSNGTRAPLPWGSLSPRSRSRAVSGWCGIYGGSPFFLLCCLSHQLLCVHSIQPYEYRARTNTVWLLALHTERLCIVCCSFCNVCCT